MEVVLSLPGTPALVEDGLKRKIRAFKQRFTVRQRKGGSLVDPWSYTFESLLGVVTVETLNTCMHEMGHRFLARCRWEFFPPLLRVLAADEPMHCL